MALPDSNTLRIVGYVIVGLLMLVARRRERRRIGRADGVWPTFWVITCALLLFMALGRIVEAGDLLSSLGRRAAGDHGWYASRRPLQAAVVGSVGAGWVVTVAVALWRTPERRRRYLPIGIMVATLGAFAVIRVVSLHQVDTLLYRTHVRGVRVATLTELALLALTGAATWWCPSPRQSAASDETAELRRRLTTDPP